MSDKRWNNADISTLKQRRDFNVEITLQWRPGLLRPSNFQIQPKFSVISTSRVDVVQRWVNVAMQLAICDFYAPEIEDRGA